MEKKKKEHNAKPKIEDSGEYKNKGSGIQNKFQELDEDELKE